MAPDWEHMRAVIDAEIAYWARQLVLGEISAVLNDLHPRLQLDHATIRLNKTGQKWPCDRRCGCGSTTAGKFRGFGTLAAKSMLLPGLTASG